MCWGMDRQISDLEFVLLSVQMINYYGKAVWMLCRACRNRSW